jgi:hypothetical protein
MSGRRPLRPAHSTQAADTQLWVTAYALVAEPGMGIDFASDVAASGQRLRVFSVVDGFTRECLALETDTSMPSRRDVERSMRTIYIQSGKPTVFRGENVCEFITALNLKSSPTS